MTVSEAADKIEISVSKLYHLVSSRQIAHYRVGGKIVPSDDDVAAFRASCRVPTNNIPTSARLPKLRLRHIKLDDGP